MFPRGDIYRDGKSANSGVIQIAASLKVKLVYHTARIIGASLITTSIVGLIFTYGPVIKDELSYQVLNVTGSERQAQLEAIAEANRISSVQNETEVLGVDSSFAIAVPKIDAVANVVANINAGSEEDYSAALKEGVAHARGTHFPGQGENIFLFSHSTDSPLNISEYNAIFYLLRKLETGDKVVVYFADKKYVYEVDYKVVTGASDTHWLYDNTDEERLVLQTCDPPGTTLNRLLVIAKPVS